MYYSFNSKLFYLTLKEYCCYDLDIEKDIRSDINFWSSWIGKDEFYSEFLTDLFHNNNNEFLLAFIKNDNHIYNIRLNLEGIIIFHPLSESLFNIPLIAKRHNSVESWIGRKLLKKLSNLLEFNLQFRTYFILIDESDIPDYYERLGFYKTNNDYFKKLLDHNGDNIYLKKISND
jgi:hypothetical protein